MKLKVTKCTLIKSLAFLICMGVFIICIMLFKKALPDIVSYTVKESDEKDSIDTNNIDKIHDERLYSDISGIEAEGPFTVKSSNGDVFVFIGDKKLYRIKTDFSCLPQGDREKIVGGITANSKEELLETVCFLES